MSDQPGRPPRWDPDPRGIGVADARAHLGLLDALRQVADEDGWVAEDPEAHLLPHLRTQAGDGGRWTLVGAETVPDGTLEVDLRWAGPADAGRMAIRTAAWALIGAIAEGATVVHEERGVDGVTTFAVVTGALPGETRFAPHGHTLRLRLGSDA